MIRIRVECYLLVDKSSQCRHSRMGVEVLALLVPVYWTLKVLVEGILLKALGPTVAIETSVHGDLDEIIVL